MLTSRLVCHSLALKESVFSGFTLQYSRAGFTYIPFSRPSVLYRVCGC